jgi:DNA-binding GntR family transcriptional regulator
MNNKGELRKPRLRHETTMPLKRIEPQPSLAQIVASQVREAIITGALHMGENISEDRLVAQFGVSRTPIRDAMAALSKEGLVVVLPKRGSFVFQTSPEDIAQICDYRQMLEAQAVRAALCHARTAYLDDMSGVLTKMDEALGRGDDCGYSLLDDRFHALAFEHCGNSYLRDAFSLISGRISALRANVTAPYAERRAESLREHHALHGMLVDGRLEQFDAALAVHVQRTGEVYLQALRDGHLRQADVMAAAGGTAAPRGY